MTNNNLPCITKKRGRPLANRTSEDLAQDRKKSMRKYYLNTLKPARESKRRIWKVSEVFEVLRDTVFSPMFTKMAPCDRQTELGLINEVAAANAIEGYGTDNIKRAQIKKIIYAAWYRQFGRHIHDGFDDKIESFRRGPPAAAAAMEDIRNDEYKTELKKQITDFVNAADVAWIDSIMPGTLIAALSAPPAI